MTEGLQPHTVAGYPPPRRYVGSNVPSPPSGGRTTGAGVRGFPNAFGNALGNSIVGAIQASNEAERLKIPDQLKDRSQTTQDAYQYAVKNGATPQQALAAVTNDSIGTILDSRQTLDDDAAQAGYDSFDTAPADIQAQLLNNGNAFPVSSVVQEPVGVDDEPGPIAPTGPNELVSDPDSIANQLGRGVSKAIVSTGQLLETAVQTLGADNVSAGILATQFALGGIPKTLITLAIANSPIGEVASQALDAVKQPVSDFIGESFFDARNADELQAVRPASNLAANLAIGFGATALGIAGGIGISGIIGAVSNFRESVAAAKLDQAALRIYRANIDDFGPLENRQPLQFVSPKSLISRQGPDEISGSQIKRLRKDMQANGYDQTQPVTAYDVEGKLIIGDGHHRVLAARQAGINQIPVRVSPATSDEATLLLQQAAEAAQKTGR